MRLSFLTLILMTTVATQARFSSLNTPNIPPIDARRPTLAQTPQADDGTLKVWEFETSYAPLEAEDETVMFEYANGTTGVASLAVTPTFPRGFVSAPGITPDSNGLSTALSSTSPAEAALPAVFLPSLPFAVPGAENAGLSFWFRYTGYSAPGVSRGPVGLFDEFPPPSHTIQAGPGVPAVFPIYLFSSPRLSAYIPDRRGTVVVKMAHPGHSVVTFEQAANSQRSLFDGHAHLITIQRFNHYGDIQVTIDGIGVHSTTGFTDTDIVFSANCSLPLQVDAVIDDLRFGYSQLDHALVSFASSAVYTRDAPWDTLLALQPSHLLVNAAPLADRGSSPATVSAHTPPGPPPPPSSSPSYSPFTSHLPLGPGRAISLHTSPPLTHTLSLWFYIDGHGRVSGSDFTLAAAADLWSLSLSGSDGSLSYTSSLLSSPLTSSSLAVDLRDAAWHNIAIVQSVASSSTSLYVDAKLVDSDSPDLLGAPATTWSATAPSTHLTLGAAPSTETGHLCISCGISFVAVFDSVAADFQSVFDMALGYRTGSLASPALDCDFASRAWHHLDVPYVRLYSSPRMGIFHIIHQACDFATSGGGWTRLWACGHSPDGSGDLSFVVSEGVPNLVRYATHLQIRATTNDSSRTGGTLHAATSSNGADWDTYLSGAGISGVVPFLQQAILDANVDSHGAAFDPSTWSVEGFRMPASHLDYGSTPSPPYSFVLAPLDPNSPAPLGLALPSAVGGFPSGACGTGTDAPGDGYEIWTRSSNLPLIIGAVGADDTGVLYAYSSSSRSRTSFGGGILWTFATAVDLSGYDYVALEVTDVGGEGAAMAAVFVAGPTFPGQWVTGHWLCKSMGSAGEFPDALLELPQGLTWETPGTYALTTDQQPQSVWISPEKVPWFTPWVWAGPDSVDYNTCALRIRCPSFSRSFATILCSASSVVGSQCSLVCASGYHLNSGAAVATCLPSGWSEPLGICTPTTSPPASLAATITGGRQSTVSPTTISLGSALALSSFTPRMAVADEGNSVVYVGAISESDGSIDLGSPFVVPPRPGAGPGFGSALGFIGDLDADGSDELAILSSTATAITVVFGPTYGFASSVVSSYTGIGGSLFGLPPYISIPNTGSLWSFSTAFCSSVTGIGDVNQDGVPDMALGCTDHVDVDTPGRGAVIVGLMSPDGGAGEYLLLSLKTPSPFLGFGRALAPLPSGLSCSSYGSSLAFFSGFDAGALVLSLGLDANTETAFPVGQMGSEIESSATVSGLLSTLPPPPPHGMGTGLAWLGTSLDGTTGPPFASLVVGDSGGLLVLGRDLGPDYDSCASGDDTQVASGAYTSATLIPLDGSLSVGGALDGTGQIAIADIVGSGLDVVATPGGISVVFGVPQGGAGQTGAVASIDLDVTSSLGPRVRSLHLVNDELLGTRLGVPIVRPSRLIVSGFGLSSSSVLAHTLVLAEWGPGSGLVTGGWRASVSVDAGSFTPAQSKFEADVSRMGPPHGRHPKVSGETMACLARSTGGSIALLQPRLCLPFALPGQLASIPRVVNGYEDAGNLVGEAIGNFSSRNALIGQSTVGNFDWNGDGVTDYIISVGETLPTPSPPELVRSLFLLIVDPASRAAGGKLDFLSVVQWAEGRNGVPYGTWPDPPIVHFSHGADVIGDVDGNGCPDVLVGAPVPILFFGAADRSGRIERTQVLVVPQQELCGDVSRLGDLTGDGVPDAVCASFTQSIVTVFDFGWNATAQLATVAYAQHQLPGTEISGFGRSVTFLGRPNGEDNALIVVGTRVSTLAFGLIKPDLNLTSGAWDTITVAANVDPIRPRAQAGVTSASASWSSGVATVGDIDGNGMFDLVVGDEFGGAAGGGGFAVLFRGPGPGPAGTIIGSRWADVFRNGLLRGATSRQAGEGLAPLGGSLFGTALGFAGNLWGPGTDTVEVGFCAREDRSSGFGPGHGAQTTTLSGSVVFGALVSTAEGPSLLSVEPRVVSIGTTLTLAISGMRLHLAGGALDLGPGGVGGSCVFPDLISSTTLATCTVTTLIESRFQLLGTLGDAPGTSVAYVDVIDPNTAQVVGISPSMGYAGQVVSITGSSLGSVLTSEVRVGGEICVVDGSLSTPAELVCVLGGPHPGLGLAPNVSVGVEVVVNRTAVGRGVDTTSLPVGSFTYVPLPPPPPPPPPPLRVAPKTSNVEADVLPSSGAASSGALALYIGAGVGLWLLLFGARSRRKNKSKYRRNPENWLSVGVDQMVVRAHSVFGIVAASKADVFSRSARMVSFVLSTNVLVLVTILMLFVKPESYADADPVSLDKLLDTLLTVAISMVVSFALGIPIIKFAFQREGAGAQKMAWVLAAISNGVLLLIDTVLVLVVVFVDGFEFDLSSIGFVFASGLVISWVVFEPFIIILSYFVLGNVAIHVRSGGNGGASGGATVAPAKTSGDDVELGDSSVGTSGTSHGSSESGSEDRSQSRSRSWSSSDDNDGTDDDRSTP